MQMIAIMQAASVIALVSQFGGCEPSDGERANIELPVPRPDSETDRYASLALECIHREFPNKISHVLEGPGDARTPRELTPAFYGCFDWHSSVHGHWLLARIARLDSQTPMRPFIMQALERSLSPVNVAGEVDYYVEGERKAFERPYGIAWLLQLVAELDESKDPQMRKWRERLRPLEQGVVANLTEWLPKLAYPIRLGTHNQTAFAFGLVLDYARQVGDRELETLVTKRTFALYEADIDCPIEYEPSGEDFLSPCLMEADLMRRVMTPARFSGWLGAFLPGIPDDGSSDWLEPGVVRDASDGKLVHLDGLNLSRAWAMHGIASGLPPGDPRIASLRASAERHRRLGTAAIDDRNYQGGHWLGSFATYLATDRGLTRPEVVNAQPRKSRRQ